ncbi:MAG: molybdenum cofactor guanylyltransferase, partial [Limisphaerales bacterium]
MTLPVDFHVQGKRKSPLIIFILAGGQSTRMGRDKARLLLGHRTFLQVITETARELGAPVEVIFDDVVPSCGPLGGILTAFARYRFDRGLFLSCDMPLITSSLLSGILTQKGAAFTATTKGAGFPCLLPSSSRAVIQEQINQGRHSIQALST